MGISDEEADDSDNNNDDESWYFEWGRQSQQLVLNISHTQCFIVGTNMLLVSEASYIHKKIQLAYDDLSAVL